jgi:hypothetical protein
MDKAAPKGSVFIATSGVVEKLGLETLPLLERKTLSPASYGSKRFERGRHSSFCPSVMLHILDVHEGTHESRQL